MRKILTIIFIVSFIQTGFSQQGADTLEKVKQLRDQDRLEEALSLLELYEKSHPNDLNTLWLYAQTAVWHGDHFLSSALYEKALKLYPNHRGLVLDYANQLMGEGALHKAARLLEESYSTLPGDREIGEYLGTVYYWQLRYREAESVVSELVRKDSSNQNARQLLIRIRQDQSPVVSTGCQVLSDDQKLVTTTSWMQASLCLPRMPRSKISLSTPIFSATALHANAWNLSAGNSWYLEGIKTDILLQAGLFHFPRLNTTDATWKLAVNQKISRQLQWNISWDHKPYLLTISSLNTKTFEDDFLLFLGSDPKARWQGKVGLERKVYPTDQQNGIMTWFGWLLSPGIKAGPFTMAAGLGYNYSDSKEDRFLPQSTVEELVASQVYGSFQGIYNPYYTPEQQHIVSVIAMANVKPWRSARLDMKASYGGYASTNYPFLYIRETGSGNGNQENKLIREYVRTEFHPLELEMKLNWQCARTWSVDLHYTYFSTIYFTSQMAGIGLKKVFWNGREK